MVTAMSSRAQLLGRRLLAPQVALNQHYKQSMQMFVFCMQLCVADTMFAQLRWSAIRWPCVVACHWQTLAPCRVSCRLALCTRNKKRGCETGTVREAWSPVCRKRGCMHRRVAASEITDEVPQPTLARPHGAGNNAHALHHDTPYPQK
jgi:hypothetical protein